MFIYRWLPLLKWLPNYPKSYLKGDVAAGITVGIVLIPQGLAYAYIAGLPPVYGLYAAITPQLIYAVFGTARQISVGPVAMDSLLVAAGLMAIAEVGSAEYIELAIILALMMGLIQFLLGVFRLGFLVNFLSRPVINGFTYAAALIIALSQLKNLLGISLTNSSLLQEIVVDVFQKISGVHGLTFLLGITGILLVYVIRRINHQYKLTLPGLLFVVVFGILAVLVFRLDTYGVKIIKEIPSGLPSVGISNFHFEKWASLFPIAFTLALVAYMEAISVGKALQAKHKEYEIDPNQELVAIGLANVGGAFFQSYPTTGGLSRSAVNEKAGAKTGIAAFISAGLIMLTLLFLTPLFYYLPQAVLASIIMVAVLGLIDIRYAQNLWKTQKADFLMFLVTFVFTLTLGIREGILIGVFFSLALVIYQTTRPHFAELGRLPDSDEYRNVVRFPDVILQEEVLIIRYDASLYFANLNHFKDNIQKLIDKKGEKLKYLVLNCESMNSFDSSALEMLTDFHKDLQAQDIALYFVGMIGPLRDLLQKVGLTQKIGENHFFLDIQSAIDYFENQDSQRAQLSIRYANQSNT